ncbi:MAG: hypothetical protein ACREIF_19080 [Chthoniobacterales bacterium]
MELADGQAAADLGFLAGGAGVFLGQIAGEEPGEIGDAAGVAAGARGQHVRAGVKIEPVKALANEAMSL